uniref:zinc finger protein 26-like n=1 Tax=Semicossyphus pulcher TaxID=241346 RepID=UPI0037E783C3
MSLTEAPPRCGLRALTKAVSEQLARVGDEILRLVEKRSGSGGSGSRLLHLLRLLLTERLAVAAERIVGLLEQEVGAYRRRLERQSRLLEAVLSPVVRLTRTDSISSSALRNSSADKNPVLPSEVDPAHLCTAPLSSAPSDVSAAESDDDWRGSDNPSRGKEPNGSRTDGGLRSRTDRQQAASSEQPATHSCVICGKSFRHKGNLVNHVETHSDKSQRLCGVCGEQFESSGGLLDHLRTHRETISSSGTCQICRKTFQNMETHMRSHTGVKPYCCDMCTKSFPRPGALRRHKKIHSRRVPEVCPVCRLTFTRGQQLQDHLKTHQVDAGEQSEEEDGQSEMDGQQSSALKRSQPTSLCCRVCGDSFHSRGFLRKHAETHCRDSQSICGVCGQQLDSPVALQAHLQSHRETNGTCNICRKSFQNMETHMRRHTGIKPYSCSVCNKRFPRAGALRRHRRIHGGDRLYACQLCGKTFMESGALKTHSRSHSKGISSDELAELQPDSQSKKSETEKSPTVEEHGKVSTQTSHCCKVCGESFQSKGGLRKHAKCHSAESACGICGESLRPSETMTDHLQVHRDTGNICHICGKTYQNIETHMRSHTGVKPYRCGVCSKSFPRPGALRRHRRIHSGERPYICEFCGKTFIDNTALMTHIRNHTGDKPAHRVSCETCGKSLASVHVLEVHKRIHTGEKPFQCLVCGKAFRQVGGLNAHMLTHTGEKPFSCSLCGKSFSTKGYLETHIRFHKKERAFSCHLCWKAFVTKNDLKKHLLTHSGEKPYGCRVCGKSYQEKRSRDVHMKVHLDNPTGEEPIRMQDALQPDFIQL